MRSETAFSMEDTCDLSKMRQHNYCIMCLHLENLCVKNMRMMNINVSEHEQNLGDNEKAIFI